MASTTALFTGLSGIVANSRLLDVTGNNIANTNTTAYKSNRMMFAPTVSRTFSLGSAPSGATGGSNPGQVGLGVAIAGTQRNFNDGAISTTGVKTDLAIEGDGFFVLNQAGSARFTRNGAFARNASNELVTLDGARVQGFSADSNFTITRGSISTITIPLGTLTIAEATQSVQFAGNLNASGPTATTGSTHTFDEMLALGAAVPPPANAPYADETTRLVDVDDGAGASKFAAGESIRITNAEKGGKIIPNTDLEITATTTVAEFLTFLEQTLGIDTSVSSNPGDASIDPATGIISIEGNSGESNDLTINTGDIVLLDSSGVATDQPFSITKTVEAEGESIRTTFLVYDSLGTPLQVDLTMVLEEKTDTGTTWRYYGESTDASGDDARLGTGTVSFDTTGQVITPAEFSMSVGRTESGAVDPLSITMSFSSDDDSVSSLSDVNSAIAAVFQDGSPIGTLEDFGIGNDGKIVGSFSNGLTRDIGQLAIATFTNNEGLVDAGNSLFATGPNSGSPTITTPMTLGSGRVIGGALELSNVDLSQEFIELILASTGYSASGRVISTSNDLFQQLLMIGR